MYVEHFFVKGLAHSSYLLGGEETCAIVDPQRDIEVYLHAAEEMGMKITHILETHLHADFVSGHLDLADATGATIYAPKSARCRLSTVRSPKGYLPIENMRIRVLETGHTPEHVSYVVTDRGRGRSRRPSSATLFVGDVGALIFSRQGARTGTQALRQPATTSWRFRTSATSTRPTAPEASAGAPAGKRWTTIGYERRYNLVLQISTARSSSVSLTTNMPAAPDHFSCCSAINGQARQGPLAARHSPDEPHRSPGPPGRRTRSCSTSVAATPSAGSMSSAPSTSTSAGIFPPSPAGSSPTRTSCWWVDRMWRPTRPASCCGASG